MKDIAIHGLTPRQHILADIIWACEDKPEVDRFIKALPTQAFRNEAKSIVDLTSNSIDSETATKW